ncbi:MAG TPA: hypothetical protein VF701_00810 [Thermoanaerobaculia bacterium]
METKRSRNAIVIAVIMLSLLATSLTAQPSTTASGDVVLQSLLEEIRALRVALQRNSAYELRGRLLIDRARLQQEVIRELSREVEGAGDYMRPVEVEPAWDIETMMTEANLEGRVAAIPNPEERRKMMEREKLMMEKRREMEARHREQMRLRHQRLEQRLHEETAKLRQIEDELAQIQTELTR